MQGSYRHYSTFFQDFPGLVKTKFQGFPGLKKLVFKDFPGYIPFSNTGCMRSKKCTYQISYRCNCITVNKPKCSTIGISNTRIDPRGGKMHTSVTMYYNEFLIYFAILKLLLWNSRTFQGIQGPMPFSRTFQAWKSQQLNSMTFQGLYEPCKWITFFSNQTESNPFQTKSEFFQKLNRNKKNVFHTSLLAVTSVNILSDTISDWLTVSTGTEPGLRVTLTIQIKSAE